MANFTRKHLLNPGNVDVVADRGIEWVTDNYILARADLFGRRPTPKGVLVCQVRAKTMRRLLDDLRSEPLWPLKDSRTTVRYSNGVARLLSYGTVFVAVNAELAAAWLAHDWHSVSLGAGSAVQFHELRRGKPVLAGAVMPVRLCGALDEPLVLSEVA
jgi:hypothetical protein